jgi:hypothetical protein
MSNDIKEWYETYEERELLKNAKKTCTFCNEVGHIVYHKDAYDWGIPICPLLKKTACSACGLIGHTPTFCEFLKLSEENTKEYMYFEIRDYIETYIDENTNTDVSQNITEKERKKIIDDCIQTCIINASKYRKKHSKKFEKKYKRDAEYFENIKREIEQIKKKYKKDWFLRVEKTPYDTPYAEQMRKSYEIYLEEYKIWKENVADLYKERVDNHNDDDLDDLDDLNFYEFIYDDDDETLVEFIRNDTEIFLDENEKILDENEKILDENEKFWIEYFQTCDEIYNYTNKRLLLDGNSLESLSYETNISLDFNEYHKKNTWYEPLITNAFNFYSKKYLN